MPENAATGNGEIDQREIIKLRNRWFYTLGAPQKQEKLFELEMLLKGLDRFFNLTNQPISQKEGVVNRDFHNELVIIRNTVSRVIKLSQGLLTEEDGKVLHFRNYVENRLLNDYQRAKNIERALLQRSPEESLYVLAHSFINFHEILAAMTRQNKCSYFLFYHMEQLISREIAANHFFNPFKAAGFAPHYDVIKSPRFTKVVREIGDPVIRKHLSILFLMMFKLLRYLSHVDPEMKDLQKLKDSLMIFALVHSESMLLVEIMEKEMPKLIRGRDDLSRDTKGKLIDHLDALAYQLSIEIRKIYSLELKDAATQKDVNYLRVGMARSRGILSTIYKQGIVQIAQVFDTQMQGRDVFPDFISRLDESLKLRKDIWLFHKVIENLEHVVEASAAKREIIPIIEAIKSMRNFIFYYQNISFQFVRCYDREEFQRFFEFMDGFAFADLEKPERVETFRLVVHTFKMFLETTLANVNNRAELRDVPFGNEEGERLLAQFLA